jgi:hypothetical protein
MIISDMKKAAETRFRRPDDECYVLLAFAFSVITTFVIAEADDGDL